MMKMTDVRLDLILSWIYGFFLTSSIVGIVLMLAAFKVEESTSAGLKEILPCLTTVFGVWANSKFGAHNRTEPTLTATLTEKPA